MLREKFKTRLADFFPNTILVLIGIYVINLGYLEDGSHYITKLPDSSIKESNRILVELDIVTIIPEINNQDLSDLIDLKAKRVNKKKEKAERCH